MGNTVTDDEQLTTRPGMYCAGESTGVAGMEAALVEGEIAGLSAGGNRAAARALRDARRTQQAFAERMQQTFELRPELRDLAQPDTIVCRCEDVSYSQLRACASAREAKLYTRAGMGPCQGRVCGSASAFLFGWAADSVRPPAAAAAVGALAES